MPEEQSKLYNKIFIAVVAVIAIAIVAVIFLSQESPTGLVIGPGGNGDNGIGTFIGTDNPIETIDGKPVIILFSTTKCPHCQWITETFEETVQEYVNQGKIIAKHWEFDIGDDTLTSEYEGQVPAEDIATYRAFNPNGTIPTYVFGGKYYRIGNAFEGQGDTSNPGSEQSLQHLEQEREEFKAVIEALLKELEE